MTESKALEEAFQEVRDIVDKFLHTGIYTHLENDWGRYSKPAYIPHPTIRKLCRQAAKENKRPFIEMTSFWRSRKYEQLAGINWTWTDIDPPEFTQTKIVIPRRKYTFPLVSPLYLASETYNKVVIGYLTNSPKYWGFIIRDYDFWLEYQSQLDRPEMRAARRLPPLEE